MTRHRGARPLARGALVAVATLLVGGAAMASWVISGTGSAGAASAGTSAVTLAPGTASAQLYPGGQTEVALAITNPNPGPVTVRSLVLDTAQGAAGFGVDTGHAGCGLAALSYATQTNGGSGWTVPGGGTVAVTLAHALSMGTGAANACQGAAFVVYLKVGP